MSDEAPQTPTGPEVGAALHGGFQAIAAALEHIASRFPAPSPFLAGLIEQIRGHAGTVAASLPQPAPDVTVTSGGWSDPNATSATQP